MLFDEGGGSVGHGQILSESDESIGFVSAAAAEEWRVGRTALASVARSEKRNAVAFGDRRMQTLLRVLKRAVHVFRLLMRKEAGIRWLLAEALGQIGNRKYVILIGRIVASGWMRAVVGC